MNAGPVTGFSVRVDGPAMPNSLQRCDTVFNNLTTRFAVDGNNQANPA